MKQQSLITRFLFHWAVSSLGLWIASALLGDERLSVGNSWTTVVIAGLVLAVVNICLKPILIFLSIPAILITLGLFMLVVNGLTLMIAAWIYEPLNVQNIWVAMLAGIILGTVNFLVAKVVEDI